MPLPIFRDCVQFGKNRRINRQKIGIRKVIFVVLANSVDSAFLINFPTFHCIYNKLEANPQLLIKKSRFQSDIRSNPIVFTEKC